MASACRCAPRKNSAAVFQGKYPKNGYNEEITPYLPRKAVQPMQLYLQSVPYGLQATRLLDIL